MEGEGEIMEKPILFNTGMVQAILEGRKTSTRRIIKIPENFSYLMDEETSNGEMLISVESDLCPQCYKYIYAPYQPGDILYVRETWFKDIERYVYRANYFETEKFYRNGNEVKIKWHPSIHMPKSAARIFLRVTDVRVERVQDITEDGARAEGWVIEFERVKKEG